MEPVPEKSWAYRLAKKIAFHDYGVYTTHFDPDQWQDPREWNADPADAKASSPGYVELKT